MPKRKSVRLESYQIRDKSLAQMSYSSMTYYIFASVVWLLFDYLFINGRTWEPQDLRSAFYLVHSSKSLF